VAALTAHIAAEDERSEFRRHVADVANLYREATDLVVHGVPPELNCNADEDRQA
jgi:hypothetical protein